MSDRRVAGGAVAGHCVLLLVVWRKHDAATLAPPREHQTGGSALLHPET